MDLSSEILSPSVGFLLSLASFSQNALTSGGKGFSSLATCIVILDRSSVSDWVLGS